MSKYLFFTCFSLIGLISNAQTNGGIINSNTMNTELEEAPQQEITDSTRFEQTIELDKVSTKKKAEKRSKDIPAVSTSKEAAVPEMEQQKISTVSGEFQYSKNQASTQRYQRSPSVNQQKAMDDAVEYFETNAPESFEYHYYKYVAGNYNTDLIDDLNEAEKLRPENSDVHVQKAAYHIIKGEDDKALEYLKKLVNENRLDKDLKYYSEDLLLSVPENGVLITHGFDDTYSAYYSQLKYKVRKDVTIISLDFLQSEAYRKALLDKGYKLPSGSTINVNYLKSICALNESKKVAISLTTPKEYFVPIQSNLYVTGLVFEYHSGDFDNLHRNEDLWNSVLKKHLVYNASNQKTKQLSSNYLPMLLMLYKNYLENDNAEKLTELDEATNKVSVQCNKYEVVRQMKSTY